METISSQPESKPKSNFFTLLAIWKKAAVGRILVSVFVLLVTFFVLYEGFFLLRDSNLPQAFLIIIAMTVVLANMVGEKGQDWHLLTSGAFLSMILPMTVFFAQQKYFVRGMTAGSVKG